MRLSFRLLAAVKDLKKKKKIGERRTSTVKARSAATEIPEDMLVEILVRLPAYSLMRFKCVSKFWSSLISSRYFTNFFYKFSSSMMRGRSVFLCSEYDEYMNYFRQAYIPFSSSDPSSTASFLQLNHDLNFLGSGTREDALYLVNALKGLVCFKMDRTILRIINLTTRQVLNVPCVKSNTFSESDHLLAWDYFGYNAVNDEYKLLRTISTDFGQLGRTARSETKVLVLGAGASWRNTKSPISHHDPCSQGISINNVLYCGVWTHLKILMLMSFDLNSEESNFIEFPPEVSDKSFRQGDLMNYQDQIAVINDSRLRTEYILDLWVLEDAGKSKWSHKTFDLPYHQLKLSLKLDERDVLGIKGTSRRGEVKLFVSQRGFRFVRKDPKITYLALYDLEKNRITRGVVLIKPPFIETDIWEDVENIMYLEA